ncbi:MAG: hypothetical protein QM762_18495 [Chryseolinea sp.]
MRDYEEVKGLAFSARYAPIDVLEQSISFSFDRKGIVFESEVQVYDSIGAPAEPKILRYDRPFYLYIKEAKAQHPYFNLWVSDPEILEKL